MVEVDRHHILFHRVAWNSSPVSRSLRAYPDLIPRIDRSAHEELHENVPVVPLLGSHALLQVRNEFECGRNTIDSMDRLMFAIEHASRHPRAHPIERDLCRLAIRGIEAQKPYLIQPRGSLR